MIGGIIIPDLSTEYFVGLGTGFFSTGILAGLFFYYFLHPKPGGGGGGPIGGQDACIQPDAPVYPHAIKDTTDLPVFNNGLDAALNTTEPVKVDVGLQTDITDMTDLPISTKSAPPKPVGYNNIVNRLLRNRREEFGIQTDKVVENRGTCSIVPDVTVEFGVQTVEVPVIERQNESIQTNPSYSSAKVGPDLVATYMDESIQTNEVIERLELPDNVIAEVRQEVEKVRPTPIKLRETNFDTTPDNITPNSIQELEVNDSPAHVWPPGTTGHISLTPIDQPSPADTAELIEYVHILENTRSIGVNPIPELLPLPLSRQGRPVIPVEDGVQTDSIEVPVREEYSVQTEQTGLNVEVNTDLSLINIDLVLPTPHVDEGIQTVEPDKADIGVDAPILVDRGTNPVYPEYSDVSVPWTPNTPHPS